MTELKKSSESISPTEWKWLKSTYDLQSNTYGYDLDYMAELGDPDATSHYLDWNQVAAVQELAELREEFSWKPWATDEPFVNRRRIIDETVDVMHFLGNILVGLGCTDEEFWNAYQSKQMRNKIRQASGTYSAKKGGLAHGSDDE